MNALSHEQVVELFANSGNPLFRQLARQGHIQPFDKGPTINSPIGFWENSSGGSYSGYDTTPPDSKECFTGANFKWTQYTPEGSYAGYDLLPKPERTSFEEAVQKLIKLLDRHVYLDGAGNDGKDIDGLAAMIPRNPKAGVYGGIDRAVPANAFWRPQVLDTEAKGFDPSSSIKKQWEWVFLSCTRGTDKPNLIIAGTKAFNAYVDSLGVKKSSEPTFYSFSFNGVPVMLEPGIPADHTYFLNTDYIKFRYHPERAFEVWQHSMVNVETVLFMGNLTCSGAKFQGLHVMHPDTPAPDFF